MTTCSRPWVRARRRSSVRTATSTLATSRRSRSSAAFRWAEVRPFGPLAVTAATAGAAVDGPVVAGPAPWLSALATLWLTVSAAPWLAAVVVPAFASPGLATVTIPVVPPAGGSMSVKVTSVVVFSPITTDTDEVVPVPPRFGVPERTVSLVRVATPPTSSLT